MSITEDVDHSGTYSILYLNARSILPKIFDLRALISVHHPDIICITASWLSPFIFDAEIAIPNYHSYRRDRDGRGGGLIIFVSDIFRSSLFFCSSNIEFLAVSVFFKDCKLLVGVLYRPPNSSVYFFEKLESNVIISKFFLSKSLFVGDFNVNVLNQSSFLYHRLTDFYSAFSLTQIVATPTHFSHLGIPSLIDLVVTPNPHIIFTQ